MTYRAEVVGSLLRPTYLAEARKQFEAGQIDAAAFKAIEDRAVNEAIALQEAAGIDIITDGELRRYAFYGHLIDSLERLRQVSAAGPSRSATRPARNWCSSARWWSRSCDGSAACAPKSGSICARGHARAPAK